MEIYEESVELTRTFVKIESTNPGTEEAAMREAILAYLKDTSCEIQLDDVGNGRKNVIATLWPENTKEESIKEKYKEVPMFIFICHMDTVVVRRGVDEESIWSRNRRAEWNFTNVWQRKLRYEVRTSLCISDF